MGPSVQAPIARPQVGEEGLARGEFPSHGFIRHDEIPLNTFLENRFGICYRLGEAAKGSRVPEARGGLPPWQMRRITEYTERHLVIR